MRGSGEARRNELIRLNKGDHRKVIGLLTGTNCRLQLMREPGEARGRKLIRLNRGDHSKMIGLLTGTDCRKVGGYN